MTASALPQDLHVLVLPFDDGGFPPSDPALELAESQMLDPRRDAALRRHVSTWLGRVDGTSHDMLGPVPVNVGTVEPRKRGWGACVTLGASARPMPGPARRRVELYLRLPPSCFHYWEGVVLEPFEGPLNGIMDVLGALGRAPHVHGVTYAPPQIVVSPGLEPLTPDLPFVGAWLREAPAAGVRLPPLAGGKRLGTIDFLTATLLHASEVRALSGGGRAAATARLVEAGIDELLAPQRRAVI